MEYEFDFSDGVGVYFRGVLEHPAIEEYNRRFCGADDKMSDKPTLSITYGSQQFEKDCIEAVKKSLENNRPFFYNAPDYIQQEMIEQRKLLEDGAVF